MSKFSDMQTKTRIKLALVANPNVGSLDIGVDTINDIVFLTGSVQDAEQKKLAEEVARSNGGIDIKNDIEVLSQMIEEEDDDIIRDVTEMANYQAEDVSIRERILGDLESDGRVNALMVNVQESGGIVRLSGYQNSEPAKRRAEEIASRVPGVREIINDIEVKKAA